MATLNSDSQWLSDTYKKILGRDVGQEGLDYWGKELSSGNQTRVQVEANINRSDEKWLGDTYRQELGRELGDEGRNWWMGDLRGKGSGKEDLTYGSERPVQTRQQVLENIKRSDEWKDNKENELCLTYFGPGGCNDNPNPPKPGPDPDPDPDPDPNDQNDPDNYDWNKYSATLPAYEIDPDSPGLSAAASFGNRLTDSAMIHINKLHQNSRNSANELRFINKRNMANAIGWDKDGNSTGPKFTVPDYGDPKEMFDYYYDKLYGDKDDD